MFSKTCEYAIRAIIYVAQNATEKKRVGIKAIAKGIASPEHFIAKILQDLSRRKLIQSVKGPGGGFYLNEESFNKSIADVVLAIDGDGIFVNCGLGLSYCSARNPCPIHKHYSVIKEKITKMLQDTKLIEFKENLNAGRLSNIIENANT